MPPIKSHKTETPVEAVLSPRTYIQVGTLVSVVLFAVSATWWFSKFDQRLSAIESNIQDRWTARDMELWALKLKTSNPTVVVPPTTSEHHRKY